MSNMEVQELGFNKVIFNKPITIYGNIKRDGCILVITNKSGETRVSIKNVILCTNAEVERYRQDK